MGLVLQSCCDNDRQPRPASKHTPQLHIKPRHGHKPGAPTLSATGRQACVKVLPPSRLVYSVMPCGYCGLSLRARPLGSTGHELATARYTVLRAGQQQGHRMGVG